MKHYIGTKQIHAEPMTQGGYHQYRDWSLPAEKDADAPGYLVEYPDGYISWSPAAQFEAAYQGLDAMSMGHATIKALEGSKIGRAAKPNEYAFVRVDCIAVDGSEVEKFTGIKNAQYPPILCLKTADGKIIEGWLPDSEAFFANDWMVID